MQHLGTVVEELNSWIDEERGADFFLLQELALASTPPGQEPPAMCGYQVVLNDFRDWDMAIVMRKDYDAQITDTSGGQHWQAVTQVGGRNHHVAQHAPPHGVARGRRQVAERCQCNACLDRGIATATWSSQHRHGRRREHGLGQRAEPLEEWSHAAATRAKSRGPHSSLEAPTLRGHARQADRHLLYKRGVMAAGGVAQHHPQRPTSTTTGATRTSSTAPTRRPAAHLKK